MAGMETNTTFRTIAAAALAAAALGVTACGGDDSATASGDGDARSERREAMLAYARCMREHGIDFPDPQPGGGEMTIRRSDDASPEKLRAAEEACEKHREAIRPPELSEEQQQELKDAALAHARCMREHGIDMPDPTFSSDGGARIRMGGEGVDPESPEFRAAQEACRDKLPKLQGEQP
jgi:hypothetical protein